MYTNKIEIPLDLFRNHCIVYDQRSFICLMAANDNKRAQRALGRSPEEKVKGHSEANNRESQGHNLNNFGKGPFDDVIF